jgi:hypothetical protein
MKKYTNYLMILFVPVVLFLIQSCLKDPGTSKEDENEITKEDFKFAVIPASPSTADEVKMVTYDCKYNALASIATKGKDITIRKRFNSQMKWPCVLAYDTISLGKLKQGTYDVILLIIDTNPTVTDSISVQQTFAVTVTK